VENEFKLLSGYGVGEEMSTQRLYLEDPYLKSFEAEIMNIKFEDSKAYVILDRTAFYPTGGGQPNDTGRLEAENAVLTVTNVFEDDAGNVVHEGLLSGALHIGDYVKGFINWERRHRLMRMHTAAHILIKAVRIFFNMPVKCVSASKDLDKSRLDFQAPIRREMLPQIEGMANKIVDENRRIIVKYLEPNEAEIYLKKYDESLNLYMRKHELTGKVRIVEIENLYGVPCGGTHVKSTGEVGSIKLLKRMSKGKGIVRVEYTVEP